MRSSLARAHAPTFRSEYSDRDCDWDRDSTENGIGTETQSGIPEQPSEAERNNAPKHAKIDIKKGL